MTAPDQLPSLARRLSLTFAALLAAVLSILSFSVYVIIAEHLQTRQDVAVQRLASLVNHLANESSTGLGFSEFDHALKDFMVGHDELAIEFDGASGPMRFGHWLEFQQRLAANEKYFRSFEFELFLPGRYAHEAVTARMIHDGTSDASVLTTLSTTLGMSSVLCALAGSLIVAWQVREKLKPLSNLAHHIRHVDASNLSVRLEDSEPSREITPLVERLNELMTRLELAYTQLKSFNADVAHELKTPLATMSSTAEVALMSANPDSEVLREALMSNLEEVERMDSVIRSMLLIATAERGTRAQQRVIASMAEIVGSVVDYHEAALEEAGLSARVCGDGSLRGDPMLIRQAISNLLSNATRHAMANTELLIGIDPVSGEGRDRRADVPLGGELIVRVTNQGAPIASHHIDRLFERFYRVDDPDTPRNTSDVPAGNGLGLSIVAAIASMHGGRVFAESVDGCNTFAVTFATGLDTVHGLPG